MGSIKLLFCKLPVKVLFTTIKCVKVFQDYTSFEQSVEGTSARNVAKEYYVCIKGISPTSSQLILLVKLSGSILNFPAHTLTAKQVNKETV